MRNKRAGAVLALLTAGVLIAAIGIASATGVSQSTLVSAAPATYTPNINDGTVYAIGQVGTRIIVGGSFTNADPPGDTNTADAVTRNYVLAFDATTGAIDTGFVPKIDGVVQAIKPGPSPDTVYIGGEFSHLNGVAARGVVLVSTVTGKMVTGFKPATMNGVVYSLARAGSHLILGGTFTTLGGATHDGIGSINATTGTLESYIGVQLTGHHNYNGTSGANGPVGPRMLDVSPDGTQAVVIGNFKKANGVLHDQIVRLTLGSTSGVVNSNWNTSAYTAACASGAFDTYMRDVSYSPDGSYFVIAATGGSTFSLNTDGTRSLCDAAARWNTAATGTNVQPAWVQRTGNDTFLSVATTGTAVYVGGHQRWVNNNDAADKAGPGAVPRPGVVALDPATGMPFAWNPGRNPRGSGAWALLPTANGLYMGSDTDKIGSGATYTTRGRIAFFPTTGGESVPQYVAPTLPAPVFLAGELPSLAGTNVLYRVNAGGPLLPAIDNGPDWLADQTDPSPYRNTGSKVSTWTQIPTINPVVPASTPSGVFNSERYDPGTKGDGGEMAWNFPVPAGTDVEVRLYFANRSTSTGTVGSRKFDVALDGTTVLSNYDIVADTGTQVGTMKKWDVKVPATGKVTINFTHEVNNPLIDGIEIINVDVPAPGPQAIDTLRSRPFTGTTAGATTTLAPGAIAWSHVRGAFMLNGTLFYGYTDGELYRASFDGTTVGTPTLIDPYNDPIWSTVDTGSGQTYRGGVSDMYGQELQSLSGMLYANGRVYYTVGGQSVLHYRYFEPDDGVLSDELTSTTTVNFGNVAGIFLAGSTLYYADKATGNLHAVAWNNGVPGGTDTVVSGPGTDGNDWRARGLFALSEPAPTAAFTSGCAALTCSFDASASTAPGGTITTYDWNFGDGSTGSGVTPSHSYASAGTYTVTLNITTTLGTGATVSHVVQPFVATQSTISFVGSSNANGTAATMAVTVPGGVQTGDAMLLLVSVAGQPTITGPAGWTLVGTSPASNTAITSQVYRRVATASDPGATVAVGFSGTPHSTVQLLAYHGTNTTSPVVSATANAVGSASSITSPAVSDASTTTWVVTWFTAKSSLVTSWTVGGAQTTRDVANGSGSGRINSIAVDSALNVPAGTVGGILGTADQAFGAANSWTIIIS